MSTRDAFNRRQRLLGVAAAAAALAWTLPAQAQSQVTITGLIDLSAGSTKAPGGTAVKGVDSGKMSTSWWGLRGTEDLGGGMSAVYAIESFMRNDTGSVGRFDADAFWARNAFVGLDGKAWGRVTLGRNTTPLFVSTLVFNAFGDSFGYSPSIRHYFTSGTVSGDTGWNDSVMYSSPNVGGFSASLIGAMGETKGRNWGGNAMYFSGPMGLSFAFQDVKKDGATAAVDDTRTWQLGGSYLFAGSYKVFAQVGDVKNRTTGNDFRLWGLGLSADVTPQGKVIAQYGHLSPDTGSSRKTFSVGYDYYMSKRTDLYLVAMSDKVSGLSSGHGYSAGIRHRF